MDRSTRAHWSHIGAESARNLGRVADRILLQLRSLQDIVDGFAVDQLSHSLQTATLAERAGADTELIVASLCHDVGKASSIANHGAIAAEILQPYVRDEIYWVIRTHQDFQGLHYYEYLGKDPQARARYRDATWYSLAEQFADDWDQRAFDPAYDAHSLDHFAPLVREVFGRPHFV